MDHWQGMELVTKSVSHMPVSVKLVLISGDEKVLVMRKDSGLLDLPGGKVEFGEDLTEAMRREVWEETGLKAKKFRFVSMWVKNWHDRGDRLVMVFECIKKKKAAELSKKLSLSGEHDWAKFVDYNNLMALEDMQAGYANAIDMCFGRLNA